MISIIIPVYNKEKFISKCLESIVTQTFHDFEVIIINDGSTDKSQCIIEKYVEQDNRIICYNIENSGVSNARNIGLNYARGDYVMFIDADDFISSDYLENVLNNSSSDIVITGYTSVLQSYEIYNNCIKSNVIIKENEKKYIFNKVLFPYLCVVWAKLFKREIIEKYNIRFPKINIGEDTCFMYKYLYYAKNIKFIDNIGYCNNIIDGTLSRNNDDRLDDLEYMISYLDSIYDFKFNRYWIFLTVRNIKIYLSRNMSFDKFIECIKVIKNKKYYKYLNILKCTKLTDAVVLIMLKLHLYRLLYLIINRAR